MKIWNSFPMLRVIPPFLIGVVSTAFIVELLGWNPSTLMMAFLFLTIVLLLALVIGLIMRKGAFFGISVWVFMIALGTGLTLSVSDSIFESHVSKSNPDESTYVIRIDDEPIVKKNSVKVTAELTNDNFSNFGRVLLYFKRDSVSEVLEYGQILVVRTDLKSMENQGNPNEFNYKRYLRFHRISSRGYVKSDCYRILDNGNPGLKGILFKIRRHLISTIDSAGLRENQLAVASALILGYRAELDKELMLAYAGAGATHVLAVSGLHVGIVYVILNFLLKFMDKKRPTKIVKTLLLIFLLFGYAGLTGLSASVFRAATMFSFVAIGKALKRDTNIFNTLAASAFCLIAYDPMIIMQVGFQLSYGAVIGIVLIQPRLFKLYAFNNRLLDWAWSITCVSIAAQIATFPLGLLYFHQFPNLFLVSNLLVIPAAAVILYVGFTLFALSFWDPTLMFCGFLLDRIIYWLNWIVIKIESIPYSVLGGIDISTFETLMIYFIIVTAFVFISLEARKALYISVLTTCLFLTIQIVEVYQQERQRQITIYNVRGETAIGLLNGTSVKFITSREFFEDEESMLFHVQHHWWNRGVTEVEFVELTDSTFNRVLDWNGTKFAVINFKTEYGKFASAQFNNDLSFAYLHDVSWNNVDLLNDFGKVNIYAPNRFGTQLKERMIKNIDDSKLIFIEQALEFDQ